MSPSSQPASCSQDLGRISLCCESLASLPSLYHRHVPAGVQHRKWYGSTMNLKSWGVNGPKPQLGEGPEKKKLELSAPPLVPGTINIHSPSTTHDRFKNISRSLLERCLVGAMDLMLNHFALVRLSELSTGCFLQPPSLNSVEFASVGRVGVVSFLSLSRYLAHKDY